MAHQLLSIAGGKSVDEHKSILDSPKLHFWAFYYIVRPAYDALSDDHSHISPLHLAPL
jgi:hypothetical protein